MLVPLTLVELEDKFKSVKMVVYIFPKVQKYESKTIRAERVVIDM